MTDPSPLSGERAAWAVLASAQGVGPVTFGSLVRRFGSATAVLAAAGRPAAPELRRPPPDPDPGAWDPFADPERASALAIGVVAAARDAERILERIAGAGVSTLTIEDAGYPARLRAIDLAPPVVHLLGDPAVLGWDRSTAIVGTRRPSEGGRLLAGRIARELVAAGAAVVSGLAVGIDGAAHAAVLDEGGITIAVLGSGHGRLSPAVHHRLAERIVAAGGAIVSEHPPDVAPSRASFPRRNRIISGLADATVVVEAGIGSGALITARWALEQGRECFVAPGPVGARASAGCLAFLREHAGLARIVAGLPELIEDLAFDVAGQQGEATSRAPADELGGAERAVLAAVDDGLGTVDQLVVETGLAAASVLGALTRLELRGLVVTALGRYRPAGARRSSGSTRRETVSAPRAGGFAGRGDPVLP